MSKANLVPPFIYLFYIFDFMIFLYFYLFRKSEMPGSFPHRIHAITGKVCAIIAPWQIKNSFKSFQFL